MKIVLTLLAMMLTTMALAGSCGLDRTERDAMRSLKDQYLAELSEIRQANDTINRNIISAYQELELLRTRLEERTAQAGN
jgi:hypothetical protein